MNPEEIFTKAHKLATENKQVMGEKRNYAITLEQLEAILKSCEQ